MSEVVKGLTRAHQSPKLSIPATGGSLVLEGGVVIQPIKLGQEFRLFAYWFARLFLKVPCSFDTYI